MARAHGAAAVVGVDEAGRGPLAGPVVAAAVLLPSPAPRGLGGARDSKRLAPARRSQLFKLIRSRAVSVSVSWAYPSEIARLNILNASLAAMGRAAVRAAGTRTVIVAVDGPSRIKNFPLPQRALIGGDDRSLAVACASIVAKVIRDRWMERMDRRFPGYGFARHKGYGTALHLEALRRLGPAPIHRRDFAPVARAVGPD